MKENDSMYQLFLEKLHKAIENKLENENFGVDELAFEIGISRSQLHRKLKALTGQSASQTIREYRLRRAMELLQNNVATAAEIAYKVGFGSPSYFNTCFHDFFGYPPGEVKFRKSVKEKQTPSTLKKASTISLSVLALLLSIYISYRYITVEKTEAETLSKSIAVLPFDNLSNDPSQDYISDGMMEAILRHLNKIEGLRLTSRTTMMSYKGVNISIPQVAAEVAVRYVLAGSVIRVDSTIRIQVQLIDGQKDFYIWSEYYDGEFSDLLNIQSEIAQKIAAMLEININQIARANIELIPTENPRAYDLYLKATHLNPLIEEEGKKYFEFLEESISLDPGFGLAYTALANYWFIKAFTDDSKNASKAESLLNTALRLDPNQPEAHRMLSSINLYWKWDFYSAESEMNYASLLEPSNVINYGVDLNCALGRFEEALESVNKWVINEPNNGRRLAKKAMVLYFNNRPEEALETLDQAKDKAYKQPIYTYYADGGRIYLYLKRYDKVIDFLEKGIEEGVRGPIQLGTLAIAYYHLGNTEKSNELLNQISRADGISPSVYKAMIYAQREEIDSAFEWLEKAYQDREEDMWWIKVEPPFEPLHNDPRWQQMLDKVGFPK